MRDEMIQEAVLDSIDAIEEARLFAECEVLTALVDTYMKALLIQESSDLAFDGYSIFSEAAAEATDADLQAALGKSEKKDKGSDKKDKPSKLSGVGEKLSGALKKIGEFIVKVWTTAIEKIKGVFRKIRNKRMAKLVISKGDAAQIFVKAGCQLKPGANEMYEVWWPTVDFEKIEEIFAHLIETTVVNDKQDYTGAISKLSNSADFIKIETILARTIYSRDPSQYADNAIAKMDEFKKVLTDVNRALNITLENKKEGEDLEYGKWIEKMSKQTKKLLKSVNSLSEKLTTKALEIDRRVIDTESAVKRARSDAADEE